MIRVLVVSGSAIARAGLEAMLRDDERFEPIQRSLGIADLPRLRLASSGDPVDVILAEISNKDSIASLTSRDDDVGSPPIVLLADDVTRSELLRSLSSGVRAVLPRDATPGEVFVAIEAAVVGLTAISPENLELLLPAVNAVRREDEPALEALSTREAEVLALMAQGLANKNIADRLRISEHTVKFHVSSILAKLGAASRTEAVTRGLKDGLLVI